MIVCKFGGSSLAHAKQIKKACAIFLANEKRRIMVVSAPGKRPFIAGDKKMTDLLLDFAQARWLGLEGNMELLAISDRILSLISELDLSPQLADKILAEVKAQADNSTVHHKIFFDAITALGEWMSAIIVSEYLIKEGHNVRMVDPRQAGLVLSYRSGFTEILEESYFNLSKLMNAKERIIFPGFYGRTVDNNTITFSRGGSDISAAVVAAACQAELYENWTDKDHVYAVNPDYVNDAVGLKEISYREMRELAYIGFNIIHPEALEPLFSHKIPLRIASTDNPYAAGTMVLAERTHVDHVVSGIACSEDFCAINIRRVLLNRERGTLLQILTIFNELDINIEHIPTGIDSISIIVREANFSLEDEMNLRQHLAAELALDDIEVSRHLAAIMIVGEGMRDTVGVISKASSALAAANINIEVIISDYHEISCLFMIYKHDTHRAIHALYDEFFRKNEQL